MLRESPNPSEKLNRSTRPRRRRLRSALKPRRHSARVEVMIAAGRNWATASPSTAAASPSSNSTSIISPPISPAKLSAAQFRREKTRRPGESRTPSRRRRAPRRPLHARPRGRRRPRHRLVPEGENWWLSVRVPEDLRRYVAEKGSIAIDGISLTVARWHDGIADIAIIPFTHAAHQRPRHVSQRRRQSRDRHPRKIRGKPAANAKATRVRISL